LAAALFLGCRSPDAGLLEPTKAGSAGVDASGAAAKGGSGASGGHGATGGGVPIGPPDDGGARDAAPLADGGDAGSAMTCFPNPDEFDEVCPKICPETCNAEDDDCDRHIDEGEAHATCAAPNATGSCDRGVCRIGACEGRHQDCDGEHGNGCEADGACNREPCDAHGDCASGFCRPSDETCRAPACDDGFQNQDETDVDCGGGCPDCAVGKKCEKDADCATDDCRDDKCYGVEDCLDGEDDDGDGDIDCADDDCGAFECTTALPVGWEGYFRLRAGAFSPALDSMACDGGADPTRYFAQPQDVGQCTACGCGSLSGATCGNQPVFCSTNGSCSVGTDFTNNLLTAACYSPASHRNANVWCWAQPTPVANAGSCGASGGAVVPTDLWAGLVDVCQGTASNVAGGGCGAMQACVAVAPGTYAGAGICIRQTGEVVCPSGWDTPYMLYTGGTDARGCAACVCTPNTTCTGGVACSEDDNSCGGGGGCRPINDANGCTSQDGYSEGTWSIHRTVWPSPSGSCAASGGAPNGQIDAVGAITYCCQ
jgi:hypothetical protein